MPHNTVLPAGAGGTPAPSGGPTIVDLSAATKTDTNSVLDGTSSLGTSSTIVASTNHGAIDTGLDGCLLLVDTGTRPAGKWSLTIRITATTPSDTPTSGSVVLSSLVTNAANPAQYAGYAGGFVKLTGGGTRNQTAMRYGSAFGSSTIMNAGDLLTGTLQVSLVDSVPDSCIGSTNDESNTGVSSSMTTATAGAWTNYWVGVGLSVVGAAETQKVTWSNVVVSYEWI